jgi:hypothetical protein
LLLCCVHLGAAWGRCCSVVDRHAGLPLARAVTALILLQKTHNTKTAAGTWKKTLSLTPTESRSMRKRRPSLWCTSAACWHDADECGSTTSTALASLLWWCVRVCVCCACVHSASVEARRRRRRLPPPFAVACVASPHQTRTVRIDSRPCRRRAACSRCPLGRAPIVEREVVGVM